MIFDRIQSKEGPILNISGPNILYLNFIKLNPESVEAEFHYIRHSLGD